MPISLRSFYDDLRGLFIGRHCGGLLLRREAVKETAKAQQAWLDYLSLGADRSLDKLAEHYIAKHPSYTNSTPKTLRRLLARWSFEHGWQARLAEIAEVERQAIVRRGIVKKQNRVDALNDRWGRMKQVITERAEDPELQDVAGGKTGLIVHNVKGVGKGEDFQLIDLYEVDTGLLAEMRATEKQAAQEIGEWTEKKELTGKDGGPIEHRDADITDEDRVARIAAILDRARERRTGQADSSGG